MRLFVSVDLEDCIAGVGAAQAPFDGVPGLSLTDPGQAHVTLKFLGEQNPAEVSRISAALDRAVAAADVGPFDARFAGLGAFPSREYIRVIWVGVQDGAAQLTTLHEHVEAELVGAGFDPADHEFTPHVTIARMEHAGGKERVQSILDGTHPDVGSMRVNEIRLTESRPTEDGPVYETRSRVPL